MKARQLESGAFEEFRYITTVPFGTPTGASPLATARKRRWNGFLREASRIAILTVEGENLAIEYRWAESLR